MTNNSIEFETELAELEAEYFYKLNENFRQILKHTRQAKGYSITELANLIGITRAALSRIENGIVYPKIDTMIRLGVILDIPIKKLFNIEDKNEQ